MKTALRSLMLAAILMPALSVQAAKFSYPDEDKEWFTVDIPASWKPEVDDDGTLEANSPEDDAYLAFWSIEGEDDLKTLDDDIETWMKEELKNIKMGDKPTEKTINGIEFMMFAGTAVEKEGGADVAFEIFLFAPKKGKLGVFYCQYDPKAPAAIKGLIKIVESMEKKK